jgi:murein DD-endopeptidase MepM/ murein hydrolase activator NlpD
MHWGVDIAAKRNTEVRAAQAGVVVDVSPDGRRKNYGNVVIIEHPGGTLTFYSHLEGFAPGIRPGLNVSAGTVIGYVGSSQLPLPKMKMWPHLHFEVLKRKITTRAGKIIVNPQMPERHEPQAWLRRRGRPISDIV